MSSLITSLLFFLLYTGMYAVRLHLAFPPFILFFLILIFASASAYLGKDASRCGYRIAGKILLVVNSIVIVCALCVLWVFVFMSFFWKW